MLIEKLKYEISIQNVEDLHDVCEKLADLEVYWSSGSRPDVFDYSTFLKCCYQISNGNTIYLHIRNGSQLTYDIYGDSNMATMSAHTFLDEYRQLQQMIEVRGEINQLL